MSVDVVKTIFDLGPAEFKSQEWRARTVHDHSGHPILVMAQEFYIYNSDDGSDTYFSPTGLYWVVVGEDRALYGNHPFCEKKIAEFRRDNPQGLSSDVLEMIDAFLKTKEATDGASIPASNQND